MHFCHLRKAHNDPVLTLDGTPIFVVVENKFQGVIFNRKLSFIPNTKKLIAKCQKALNLLRVVTYTDWAADRKVLSNLYRTIIRSKLSYGSIMHCSKYIKEQMIFSHRHYCNICKVQRPINSYASSQDCSILLQHFGEASKFETTRLSIRLMPYSLNGTGSAIFEFSEMEFFFS